MKIIEIEITNTKTIRAFKCKLDGDNLEVAGGTATGKTTAISALWDILEKKADQLTHGKKKGEIRIVLGDGEKTLVAKRVNTKSSSTIKLSDADGNAVSVKDFKQMVSELSVNPHKIMDMKPKERTATLLRAANLGDVDLDQIDQEIAENEDKRLEAHRKAEAVKPGPEPDKVEHVDGAWLRDKIRKAEQHNAKVDDANQRLQGLAQERDEAQEEIARLEERLSELKGRVEELAPRIEKGQETCDKLEKQDVQALWEEHNNIDEVNKKAAEYEAWEKRNQEHERHWEEKRSYDDKVKELREQKEEALDNAEWPLDGLSIEDGDILYKGVLLSNLGESEQMLVCAALAMEDIKKHDIRVVRMDGAESLSPEDFKKLQELFNGNDVQVLSSRVSRGDIEEGEIEIVEGVYE